MLSGPYGRQEPGLPQVFGRYLLVQRLSRGGMGEIFLAKHGLAGFEKLAVIKKVLPHLAADAQFISRFVDEAQVAIKLQHVNVAQVFEVGRVGDEYFLALEYVEGRDLRRTLALLGHRKQRMPVDLALFIGRELANGLAYAHRRTGADGSSLNLVHCDISPPNVLVSFEGETKVIDFGIAKSALRGTATDPKLGFGKFGYMAPEQLIRGGQVDYRTDIYAAGVVLYELLTGQRLYEAGPEPDYRALAKKVTKGEHPLPSEADPSLAPYDDLVATALRPKLEDRYQSAAEFRDAIQQALVAVNPTISTDQLGAYMRELFADEMTGQRELHDRVAATHLADFQEQMHTQTISTVSFAMAQLPANLVPEAAPRRPKRTTRSQSVRMTGTQAAAASPSANVYVPDDVPFPDGTGSKVPTITEPASRTKILVVAGVAAIVAVAGIALAMKFSGGSAPVAQAPSDAAAITVSPIEPPPGSGRSPPAPPAPPVIDNQPAVAVTPDVTPDKPDRSEKPAKPDKGEKPDPKDKKVRDKTKPGKPEATEPTESGPSREQVISRYKAVRAEYQAFRSKNGDRLEQEWEELALYFQYHQNDSGAETLRRLDAFHAKIK
jgi:eukaryotic-like serine/threonine-protein kinase